MLGSERSVAGSQSSDLGFIVNEQLRSDHCVRSVGSTRLAVMHGSVELVEPRNDESIRCGHG
jgi:hypothetical protein